MKKLSEWQLSRLRDCLRAYHAYGTGSEKVSFNWKDVSEAIDEYTGAKISAERLRQFVEGINDGAGGRKHPVPKAVDAIWTFATHEELNLISESELTEFRPSYQAGLRLLEYLKQNFDTQRIMPPAKLVGSYRCKMEGETDVRLTELVLEMPSEDGLISVAKTEEYFDHGAEINPYNCTPLERKELRNSRIKFSGFAILTPEDNLMFFLKNERNGRNSYYFTMSSDFDHSVDTPVTQLVLLDHDYPLEPDYQAEDPNLLRRAISEAQSKIAVYGRVG